MYKLFSIVLVQLLFVCSGLVFGEGVKVSSENKLTKKDHIEHLKNRLVKDFEKGEDISNWWSLYYGNIETYEITHSDRESKKHWIGKTFTMSFVKENRNSNQYNIVVKGFDDFPYHSISIEGNHVYISDGSNKKIFAAFPMDYNMLFADAEYEKKFLADAEKYSTEDNFYAPARTQFWHVDGIGFDTFKVSQDCYKPLYYTFKKHFGITEWKIDGGYRIKRLSRSAVTASGSCSIGYNIEISPDSRYMATSFFKEKRYYGEKDRRLCIIDLKDDSVVKVLSDYDIGTFYWHSDSGKQSLFVEESTLLDDDTDFSDPVIFHCYEIINGKVKVKENFEAEHGNSFLFMKWSPDFKKAAIPLWDDDFYNTEGFPGRHLLAISYDNCKTFHFLKHTTDVYDFCWLNNKEILAENANDDIVKIDITNKSMVPVISKGNCFILLAAFDGKPLWIGADKKNLYVGEKKLSKYEHKFGSSVYCNNKHIAVIIDSCLQVFDSKYNLIRQRQFYNYYLEGMLADKPILYLQPRGGSALYEYNFVTDKLKTVIYAKDVPLAD